MAVEGVVCMHRAVLFLVLTFSLYAAAQTRGTVGTTSSTSATAPNVSPGMGGQPATGPAATAPTTNLGTSATQPLGTGQFTTGSTGNVTTTTGTGGGIVTGGAAGGYVPLLQTPEAAFSSGITTNLPNNPAGISNNPSALQSAPTSAGAPGVFNTGAADFGMSSGAADGRSLGEVARDFRAQRGTQQAAKVYTNADIARLNQNQGTPLSSNLGPQGTAAANTPAAAPSSPTTPAVNNNPAQPGQNQNLPGSEAQPR
jgi:hypothetical protein